MHAAGGPGLAVTSRLFALSVGAAAVSGLLFGFDTAVIAGVTADIRRVFALDANGLGLAVSAALWGTFAGALMAGRLGDRWGSRAMLRVTATLYAVSAVGSALCSSLETFVTARVVGGLAIGASSVLSPVYLAEIAPPDRRGRLVGLFQLCIVIGVLAAYLSNAIVALIVADAAEWRWKLGVALLPAIALAVILERVPDSPRWLAARGRFDAASEAAGQLGMDWHYSGTTNAVERVSGLDWRRHRKPISLAVALAAFNQLTGINAVLYYLNDIFAASGFGKVSSDIQSVVIGIANLVATLIGISLIDRVGRRALLSCGAVGMGVALVVVASVQGGHLPATLLLPSLVLFILSFGTSQGAVIWVYLSEIFPQHVRAQGAAVGAAVHWVMNALIAAIFPFVAGMDRALPFLFFASAMLVQLIAVRTVFPETRGRSLDTMMEEAKW